MSQRQHFRFTPHAPEKSDAGGRAIVPETVGNNDGGVSAEIRGDQLDRRSWRNDYIEIREYLLHGGDCQPAHSIGVDVFHRRNETRHTKHIRPVLLLARKQTVLSRTRQFFKGSGCLRLGYREHRAPRKIRKFNRGEGYSEVADDVDGIGVDALRLRQPRLRLAMSGNSRAISGELPFEVADAQATEIQIR